MRRMKHNEKSNKELAFQIEERKKVFEAQKMAIRKIIKDMKTKYSQNDK